MRVAKIGEELRSGWSKVGSRTESRVRASLRPLPRTPVIRDRKSRNNNKGVWQSAFRTIANEIMRVAIIGREQTPVSAWNEVGGVRLHSPSLKSG